jgi:maltokinase
VGQRFFRTKGHAPTSATTVRSSVLIEGDPALVHAMVSIDGGDPYQLLFGLHNDVPDHLAHAVIGRLDGRTVYDAAQDPDLMAALLDLLLSRDSVEGLRFQAYEPVESGGRPRQLGVEQSNTSLVFGQSILKLYRQPEPGGSRDVDLHRALAGNSHIATPLGVLTDERSSPPVVLAFLQRFLPDAVEGWAMATASVRDLLAEGDLRADEVGGDFAGEASRLGETVAVVHDELRRALGETSRDARELAAVWHERLGSTVAEVPSRAPYVDAIRATYDAVAGLGAGMPTQRVHGDLHLGQTLRTPRGWLLIDFEGEPAAPLAERVRPDSALRDVAGMLRSFDYAAFHQILAREPAAFDDAAHDSQLTWRANEWAERNRAAFCEGYALQSGTDPRDQRALLRAFELDKAVYELLYETRSRPAWAPIPLASIARLSQESGAGTSV